MRILIIDDHASRYGCFVDDLASIGVDRSEIDIVTSALDARDRLDGRYYDLAILDLILPLRPENEPDVRHSLDLLIELHESTELIRPGHIMGITADRSIIGDASKEFEERTWYILDYAADNDGWRRRAINCVQYLQRIKVGPAEIAPNQTHQVDLAIICALAEPELEEVLKLSWNWSEAKPISDAIFIHEGYIETTDGQRITVCAMAAPRMGMVSTALHSAGIISLLRPHLLTMCGICAGVKGKTDIGDVILAEPAWDYQSGKRVRDKKNSVFSIAPHQLYPNHVVRTHVQQLANDKKIMQEIYGNYTGGRPSNVPELKLGPLASGSAVLADGEAIHEIKAQHRNLHGIEMEVYGMYAAAHTAPRPQPMVFAMKAVCDFADPDKDNDFQRYAAYNSANTLKILMERYGLRLLGRTAVGS